jgi:hypothetical protein
MQIEITRNLNFQRLQEINPKWIKKIEIQVLSQC